jgi:sugar lactone lactonase YvrE
MVVRADQLTEPVAYHGEGPVWSEQWGGLRWVDMFAGDVLSLSDGGVARRHVDDDIAAALRPRRGGGAVIGVARGFVLEDADGTLTRLPEVWSEPDRRMNEGACDPDGRFYCGSMALDRRPGGGALYRLDPDRSVHVVLTDVTISNGLDWSPDGASAYFNDTETLRVDVFRYDPVAGLHDRRPFVDVAGIGRPDGLTVDRDGGVWVALNHSGTVRRYTARGVLDEVIEVPARKVTACTFGGDALDELFITTSREDLAPTDDPLAGSLFHAAVGVTGQPTRTFDG